MTTDPAIDWLEDEFTDTWATWEFLDKTRPGTSVIKPMIQLRSLMAAGKPMTVTAADYTDPDRWWL